MSEKEHPQEVDQETPTASVEETIDLAEWRVKNQAYLEKRAREKEQAQKAQSEKKSAQLEASKDTSKGLSSTRENASEVVEKEELDSVSEERLDQELTESDLPLELEENPREAAEEDSDLSSPELLQTEELESVPSPIKSKKLTRPKNKKKKAFIYKTVLFGIFLFLMLVGCLYLVSPLSKLKQFEVSGLTNTTKEQVLLATNIAESDYTAGVLLDKQTIEETIEDQLVWVDKAQLTYQFPTTFKIAVKEKYIVGYVKDGANYYPVLSSGETIDTAVTEETLPTAYLLFRMTDLELVRQFVVNLAEENMLEVAQHIQAVELSPTQATNDLLSLTMTEGHTVLVPLSELGKKLAFYEAISQKLTVLSYIDMEAGIYTYAK
ncbi:cell division protein FtsQ/DivIB [Streptococcus ovuberis]|uniref:Cell division protein DivIB n=1 Tax=Streptococcus ovuberis TaxID=1936207 RepID=A0A7X6MXU2_9STRE|nr:FtsQ-type POTRA domain-containing protein [Streptococcus ovuberis]NKZ20350.1 FtsQ-type POTRA domain-containing protein [Streptococcus ovuberis]